MMIILTLLSETSKRSFEIDRCNSEINREPIYTLFIFFFSLVVQNIIIPRHTSVPRHTGCGALV